MGIGVGGGRMFFKHGHAKRGIESSAYGSWMAMRQRCGNPRCRRYSDYGGRGIRICERWNDFASFLDDMGERPKGTSIDRYPDPDGNYEPGNCRWATAEEQSRNRTSTKLLTFRGLTKPMCDWAEDIGICYMTLVKRIRSGGPIERAL